MKYVINFLVIVLHSISVPLTNVFLKTQKWYLPLWKTDKILYFAFAPFYWFLFLLTFLFGFLADKVGKNIE